MDGFLSLWKPFAGLLKESFVWICHRIGRSFCSLYLCTRFLIYFIVCVWNKYQNITATSATNYFCRISQYKIVYFMYNICINHFWQHWSIVIIIILSACLCFDKLRNRWYLLHKNVIAHKIIVYPNLGYSDTYLCLFQHQIVRFGLINEI